MLSMLWWKHTEKFNFIECINYTEMDFPNEHWAIYVLIVFRFLMLKREFSKVWLSQISFSPTYTYFRILSSLLAKWLEFEVESIPNTKYGYNLSLLRIRKEKSQFSCPYEMTEKKICKIFLFLHVVHANKIKCCTIFRNI